MIEDDVDPFEPVRPKGDDIGRLVSRGMLEPGWQCRWCSNLLGSTPAENGVVCINCDDAHGTYQERNA